MTPEQQRAIYDALAAVSTALAFVTQAMQVASGPGGHNGADVARGPISRAQAELTDAQERLAKVALNG